MEIKVISQDKCNPCKMVKNYLNSEDINYQEINISKDKSAIDKYNVMSTPVTILLEDNEEIARVNGFDPVEIGMLAEQL